MTYTNEQLIEELAQANSLLRSAYSIASRNGEETNWEAFRLQLKMILDRQHKMGILKGYWEFQSNKVLSKLVSDVWACPRCGQANPIHNGNDYVNECWNCHMPILGSAV